MKVMALTNLDNANSNNILKEPLVLNVFGGEPYKTKLPASEEAEDGIVNLIAHNVECLYQVEETGITRDFFYSYQAAFVFDLIMNLYEEGKGQHPSQFTIVRRLRAEKDICYFKYFERVVSEVYPKEWLTNFMDKLINTYQKRLEIAVYQEAYYRAFDSNVKANNSLAETEKQLEKIAQVTQPLDMFSGKRLEKRIRDDYEEAPNRPKGATWGIASLDAYTGGLKLGDLSVIYAKPGIGKTSLLWDACIRRARTTERWQLWITLGDMTAPQLFRRGMQQQTGLSSTSQAQGNFVDKQGFDQWEHIDFNLKALRTDKLIILEPASFYTYDLRRVIRRALRHVPTIDVYIDHIGLFSDISENIEVKTNLIAQSLLYCAHKIVDAKNQHLVSITAVSPINKSGTYKGSTDIGHAAENVFSIEHAKVADGGPDLSKDPNDQSGYVNFKIDKNRNGGIGSIPLWWDAKRALFMDKPNDYKM